MDIQSVLIIAVLSGVVGALLCWHIVARYHRRPVSGSARETALWRRINDLQALLHVPPLFWQVWVRYTRELSQVRVERSRGKHAAGDANEPNQEQTQTDVPGPRDGRDGDQR